MAVLTLNAKAHHMMLVTERDWLIRTLSLPGYPWGALQLI
jgi:hypothetical protein